MEEKRNPFWSNSMVSLFSLVSVGLISVPIFGYGLKSSTKILLGSLGSPAIMIAVVKHYDKRREKEMKEMKEMKGNINQRLDGLEQQVKTINKDVKVLLEFKGKAEGFIGGLCSTVPNHARTRLNRMVWLHSHIETGF